MNSVLCLPRCLRSVRDAAPFGASIVSLLFGTLAFAPSAAATPLDGAWSQFAPYYAPTNEEAGRTSFTLVLDTARNRLIAFSGDPGPKNDVWTLSLTPGSSWTALIANGTPPSRRYGAAAIYDPAGDRMIVFGGYSGVLHNDVWELSLSGTPAWTQLSPGGIAPTPRQDVAAVYDPVAARMILFGGFTGGWTNETWSLSLTGAPHWTQLAPTGTAPSPRNTIGYAHDSIRNRLIVFGGWGPGVYLGDTHALDLAGSGAWTQIATANSPPPRRQSYAAYDPVGDAMLLFGGYADVNYDDTWRLPLGGTPDWSPLSPAGTPPSARYGGRGAYDPVNLRFLVCGGVNDEYRIDVQALELSGPATWSTVYDDLTADSPHPGPRRDYSLSLDPATSVAYMFGGTESFHFDPYFGGTVLVHSDELHALPLANPNPQWLKLTTALPRPSPRHGHRSVWDPVRHRVLMFGGYDVGFLNDLWAMTPSPSPTWSQVATIGTPPDPRMLFGMGYDSARDRLLVVGGHSGFPPNGAYPFRNDVWALPLSGPNALNWELLIPSGTPPDPRWIYGMVADAARDRLLLFGGVTAATRPNDVWALNLGGGTSWTQLAPLGVPPSGRSDHAMVYEPGFDRLVIFGGFDGSFVNDSWMLKLSGSPTWTQLSPTGWPPVGRDIHHAVYDPLGGRMVCYGGWSGSSILADTWALTWIPGVVPVMASLVSADAEPGRVSLRWFVPDASHVEATVERSDDARTWRELGLPTREGVDQLTFEDRSVQAGARYEYRLHLRLGDDESRTSPAVVQVPVGLGFELAGASPNPSSGDGLRVSFSLPSRMPARLSLIDAGGRMIATRDVGDVGGGWHLLDIADGQRLVPGMYIVRLEGEDRSFSRKALVVR